VPRMPRTPPLMVGDRPRPALATGPSSSLCSYSWYPGDHARAKAWYRDVPERQVAPECAWLTEVAYAGRAPSHELTTMTALTRYPRRPIS
jgi:hypothetical protein